MKNTNLLHSWILSGMVLFIALGFACTGENENTGDNGNGDATGDPCGDSDTDSDGDGDSDGDTNSDGDIDIVDDRGEIDTDTETDTESCDTVNPVLLYLSADDSNSMASPVEARALIEAGYPANNRIRTYEFLNYYNFAYQAAPMGTIAISAQARPSTLITDPDTYDLQIGVRSPDLDNSSRRPINITLCLDTSGSMSGHALEMVKASCLAIAGSLKNDDIVSMVTWDESQNTILDSHVVTGENDPSLVSECNSLSAGSGTDLNAGLVTAYALAQSNFSENRINRVVLMSDGGANVGVTSEYLIAEHAKDANGEGIYLIGVGMVSGTTGYNDALMDTVTDAGKGAYIFIDDATEADYMFGTRFVANMEVAARDVRVELTLPATFEMLKFYGEEYSNNPAEVDPQHLAYNDAMIYNQIIGSCDPSVVDLDDEITITATYTHPSMLVDQTESITTSFGQMLTADATLLIKGNAIVAYAEALKELKTMGGNDAIDLIDDVLIQIGDAISHIGSDADLQEIESLLQLYQSSF